MRSFYCYSLLVANFFYQIIIIIINNIIIGNTHTPFFIHSQSPLCCFCFVALQQENPNTSVGNKQAQDHTEETTNLVRKQY